MKISPLTQRVKVISAIRVDDEEALYCGYSVISVMFKSRANCWEILNLFIPLGIDILVFTKTSFIPKKLSL